MTSHREAPRISKDPAADNTDLYAFVSPEDPSTVTIISNYVPLEEPAGGPNFHMFDDDVLYEINIDNDNDGIEEIIYQFRFKTKPDPTQLMSSFLYNKGPITSDGTSYKNLNVLQTYTVTRVAGGASTQIGTDLLTAPANIGPESTPNYDPDLVRPAIKQLPNNEGTVFAGPRAEAFYVDLGSIFDLLLLRPFSTLYQSTLPIPPTPTTTVNDTSGFNVHSIALQVPINKLTSDGSTPNDPFNPAAILGIYASASRQRATILTGTNRGPSSSPTLAGPFVQVSRLGVPLINEVLIPLGMKDFWNASEPKNDSQFAEFYSDPEPARLIPQLYPVPVPSAPRPDIVAALLTGFSLKDFNLQFTNASTIQADLLRLNVAVQPTPTLTNPLGRDRLGILARGTDDTTSNPDLAGFPNGRRVFDDVVDIEIQALAGATPFSQALFGRNFNQPPNSRLGDGVNTADKQYLAKFPYLATPQQGYLHVHTHD